MFHYFSPFDSKKYWRRFKLRNFFFESKRNDLRPAHQLNHALRVNHAFPVSLLLSRKKQIRNIFHRKDNLRIED